MIARQLIKKAGGIQLQFPKNELERLKSRIEEDYRSAVSDHDERMRRFQSYYMRWRGRTEPTGLGDDFRVPVTQWHVFSKWAKEQASLFGDDAQIVAKPIGPNDQRHVRKIERFINWRLFSSMKIQNPATIFNFRKILFGRSHAYCPYVRETYMVPLEDGGMGESVHYEGPAFFPQWPDDIVVPAEEAETIHDFSFVVRKYRATPDDLLRGEGTLYQGIRQNFDDLVTHAASRRQRGFLGEDKVKEIRDLAEGVLYEGNLSAANNIVIHEWYGKWRRLKGKQDAREDNLTRREEFESDLVIRYVPGLQLIIGVQDLADLYPARRYRRPFVEASLVKDGSYWGPSFGELLERIEAEVSANHNLASRAGRLSVGPVIFYSPASGFDPDSFEYEPGTAVAVDDPNGIKTVEMRADLNYPVVKEQTVLGYGERVTGVTDMNMGRSSDRPNAPKTARATLALLEEGDVRASLDTSVLREDWGTIIAHFWSLDCMYAPRTLFFRVAEDDADGLSLQRGGSTLTEEDRFGTYDFDLKFATNVWSREQRKQDQIALYQIDLQNPLIINNPRALWKLLDAIHKCFGDDRFSDLVPEPADLGLQPVTPKEEWTRLLQGEQIQINPLDNDELHIMDHNRRLSDANHDPHMDQNAYDDMVSHVLEHTDQLRQKKLMAELTSRISESLGAGTGGLVNPQPPQTLTNLHQTVGAMIAPQDAGGQQTPQRKAA